MRQIVQQSTELLAGYCTGVLFIRDYKQTAAFLFQQGTWHVATRAGEKNNKMDFGTEEFLSAIMHRKGHNGENIARGHQGVGVCP